MSLCAADTVDPHFDMMGPILTHMQHVTTVTNQVQGDQSQTSVTPEVRNGRHRDTATSPAPSTTYLYSTHHLPQDHSGPLGFLWKKDARSQVFVECFMFWLDTVELLRTAEEPLVFYSAWVFPVYIFTFLSTLRTTITPNNTLLSSVSVALQDIPFFVLRVALIAVFGFVTPVFYPLKNVLVSFTFIYFTYLTRLKIFRQHSLF